MKVKQIPGVPISSSPALNEPRTLGNQGIPFRSTCSLWSPGLNLQGGKLRLASNSEIHPLLVPRMLGEPPVLCGLSRVQKVFLIPSKAGPLCHLRP